MSTATPDVITRYFAAADRRDTEAVVALFTHDAAVVDESRTWRGLGEIRAWRDTVASAYRYTTEVRGAEAGGEGTYHARVHLEGDFPGGTADLEFHFTLDGDRISRLEIAP